MSTPRDRVSRRAIILIDHLEIARYLDLPDSLRIIGVRTDDLRYAVQVIVEGDHLEVVDPACEPPVIERPRP